jgi:glycosyltransferase involved in cell wall biosynthesis
VADASALVGDGDFSKARIAFIHEWLVAYAGSERVLAAMARHFPGAPIYSLVHDPSPFRGTEIDGHPIYTSALQRFPGRSRWFRFALPLMPFFIEQFDLRDADIVISSSHAVAKGILTREDQLHISMVHTPARYAWDLHHEYVSPRGTGRAASLVARSIMHYLRLWDVAAANRVDYFLANSEYVARRIQKTYRRRARVLYPPVDVERFDCNRPREDFYLTVSRLVPYKQVGLIVSAFTRLRRPLTVIGDGPEMAEIRRLAGPTVRLLGYQPDAVVKDHLERCRAFVFAADEDFGIAPVEAQAAGAPVIAYNHGGVRESTVLGATSVLFDRQCIGSLVDAVLRFEARPPVYHPDQLKAFARRFSVARFDREFVSFVEQQWAAFQKRRAAPATWHDGERYDITYRAS